MAIELFLESQVQRGEDSPHHLAMMHEMFQHAAAEGRKEAEWTVCQGHWQKLPQLNPKAGIPAIQLVGLETSEKERQELYLEVYKLHRLPRSPPWEPALLEEVVSSLEDCQGQREERTSTATARSWLADPQPSRSRASRKGKRDSLVEMSLATICEAHQKRLAAVAALEEEIKRLSHTRTCPEVRVRSKSKDPWGHSREEQRRKHHQVRFEDHPAPNCPSSPRTVSSKEAAAAEGSDLEDPLELGLEVASFLRGSMGASKDKDDRMPPEPTATEFSQWVQLRANGCKTPSWWAELSAVPEVGDHKRLAREVQASFWLPQRMRELRMKEANLQAPPMPPCLCWQKFMPPAKSIYTCRDIREIPQEKAVAYARALQHWAEKINLPAGGRPCLLAESVKELREEVKCYLSFSNEEVFQGVALPKKEDDQSPETMTANVPKTPCVPQPAMERRGPKFLGWGKILHPSQPVVTAGEISHPLRAQRPRGPIQFPQARPSKPPAPPSGDSHPIQTLLASMGISCCPTNDTTIWLCQRQPAYGHKSHWKWPLRHPKMPCPLEWWQPPESLP